MSEKSNTVSVRLFAKRLFNIEKSEGTRPLKSLPADHYAVISQTVDVYGIKHTSKTSDPPEEVFEIFPTKEFAEKGEAALLKIQILPQRKKVPGKRVRFLERIFITRPNLGPERFSIDRLDPASWRVLKSLWKMLEGHSFSSMSQQQMSFIWLGHRVRTRIRGKE